VAARNRAALELNDMVELREGDLLAGVTPGSLRVVVSNPPYVSEQEFVELASDVRLYEPQAALTAGPQGLDVFRRLLPAAARALSPGGAVFLEIGETQAAAVTALAEEAGFVQVEVFRDLAGKERIVRASLPGAVILPLEPLTPAALSGLRAGLRAGALLALPTDTVYGLAVAWDSSAGARNLARAKGREEDKPLQVLFASVEQVKASLPDLEPRAARVLECLLPGPYTFVVQTAVPRPPLVGTSDSLGIRVPDHPRLSSLLAALETPLAASSANLAGAVAPASLSEVDLALLSNAAVAFGQAGAGSAEALPVAPPSTVVDLRPLASGGEPGVLREGAVSAEEVRRLVASCD
jgi:tRNA threonylcarbamoyl adenosine modification protein (Sua5/YciO/YrdC/YwlC family)